jgi:hypothetical protein
MLKKYIVLSRPHTVKTAVVLEISLINNIKSIGPKTDPFFDFLLCENVFNLYQSANVQR